MGAEQTYYKPLFVDGRYDPRATVAQVLQPSVILKPKDLTINDPLTGQLHGFYVPNSPHLDTSQFPSGKLQALIAGPDNGDPIAVTIYQVESMDGVHWMSPDGSSLDNGNLGGGDILEEGLNVSLHPYIGIYVVPDDPDSVGAHMSVRLWIPQSIILTAAP